MRRLIFIAVQEGQEPEADWEGEFSYWELYAILDKVREMLEEEEFAEEYEAAGNEEEED